jgi:hypothetical protein
MKIVHFLLTALMGIGILSMGFSMNGVDPITANVAATSIYAGAVYVKYAFPQLFIPRAGVFGNDYVGVAGPDGSAGIQTITTERDRAAFVHNKTNPKYAGKDMFTSYLRLECVIKNNQGKLTFKTFEGDANSVYPTERRLDRNDSFIVTEGGFFLLKQDVGGLKTNGKLLTYPNATVFGAAADDLYAIYHSGELRIAIGKKVIVPGLDLFRFLCQPITMQSAAGNLDSRHPKAGIVKFTPQLELDGSGTNEIEINFTPYANWAGASAVAGTEHRAVLYLKGLLVTGGSANT